MTAIRVECHAGYRGEEKPRRLLADRFSLILENDFSGMVVAAGGADARKFRAF